MVAIAVIASVTEPGVPREGRVVVTDSDEDLPYTQRVVNVARAIVGPVFAAGALISMAAAAYGWLSQRVPGSSAATLAQLTTVRVVAGVAVLALVAVAARSLARRGRRRRAARR